MVVFGLRGGFVASSSPFRISRSRRVFTPSTVTSAVGVEACSGDKAFGSAEVYPLVKTIGFVTWEISVGAGAGLPEEWDPGRLEEDLRYGRGRYASGLAVPLAGQ